MSVRYDGINTLAGIAQAGYTRRTAKALEEANKIDIQRNRISSERNRIMRADSIRAQEDSRLMRLDREEAKREKTVR